MLPQLLPSDSANDQRAFAAVTTMTTTTTTTTTDTWWEIVPSLAEVSQALCTYHHLSQRFDARKCPLDKRLGLRLEQGPK
jgi:hypothetical protein